MNGSLKVDELVKFGCVRASTVMTDDCTLLIFASVFSDLREFLIYILGRVLVPLPLAEDLVSFSKLSVF